MASCVPWPMAIQWLWLRGTPFGTPSVPDVQQMVAEYDRRRRLMVSGFNRLGLKTFEPKGAFYAFPNITGTGWDERSLATALLEEAGIAVIRQGRHVVEKVHLRSQNLRHDLRSPRIHREEDRRDLLVIGPFFLIAKLRPFIQERPQSPHLFLDRNHIPVRPR